MTPLHFSEDDKKKFTHFLNMVATHSKFTLDTFQLLDYAKLLAHMQTQILPKIDANILEVRRVIEAQKSAESEKGE